MYWPSPVVAVEELAPSAACGTRRVKSMYAPHGPDGMRSGQPVTATKPASAAPRSPGAVAPLRPGLAAHARRQHHQPGFPRDTSPVHSFSAVPGVGLDHHIGPSTSRCATARAFQCVRSGARPSLLWLKWQACARSPDWDRPFHGGMWRSGSTFLSDSRARRWRRGSRDPSRRAARRPAVGDRGPRTGVRTRAGRPGDAGGAPSVGERLVRAEPRRGRLEADRRLRAANAPRMERVADALSSHAPRAGGPRAGRRPSAGAISQRSFTSARAARPVRVPRGDELIEARTMAGGASRRRAAGPGARSRAVGLGASFSAAKRIRLPKLRAPTSPARASSRRSRPCSAPSGSRGPGSAAAGLVPLGAGRVSSP